jgi:hypothetical protein
MSPITSRSLAERDETEEKYANRPRLCHRKIGKWSRFMSQRPISVSCGDAKRKVAHALLRCGDAGLGCDELRRAASVNRARAATPIEWAPAPPRCRARLRSPVSKPERWLPFSGSSDALSRLNLSASDRRRTSRAPHRRRQPSPLAPPRAGDQLNS